MHLLGSFTGIGRCRDFHVSKIVTRRILEALHGIKFSVQSTSWSSPSPSKTYQVFLRLADARFGGGGGHSSSIVRQIGGQKLVL